MNIKQEGSGFAGWTKVSGRAVFQQGNIINTNAPPSPDECLRALHVTDPRLDKSRIQESKGELLTECYNWVLQNSHFLDWRNNQDQRLLWVSGNPGKGKTMLLCGIINELEKQREQSPGNLLSYFFCQATDERLGTATAVLRGLMSMLLAQEPSLVSHMQEKFNLTGKALFEDVNAWQAMKDIFTKMLHDPKLEGVYFLVDALDECSTGLEQLLDLITDTKQPSSAKWLVSSRDLGQTGQRLDKIAQKLSLEANSKPVLTAVDSYITIELRRLTALKEYEVETARELRRYLSSNANGTFLWVALVCQNLESTDGWDALEEIKSFPPGLNAVYERMMQAITRKKNAELCKKFLAIVATAYRPLQLAEFITLIGQCHAQAKNPKFVRGIISICDSFLFIRNDTIYFVHQSAKDFLMDEEHRTFRHILPSGIEHHHQIILSNSLHKLTKTLKRDIYGLRKPGSSIEEISPPDPDPLAPLKYSSTHWVDHLEHANPAGISARGDLQDNASVHTFLEDHFLYWLEAQSLIGGVPQAVAAMQKLQTLVGSTETQLVALIKDACRFVLYFKQYIEAFPLQLYVAGHLFSPVGSLVRQLPDNEAPTGIKMLTEIDTDWSACLQTLEDHGMVVSSVAFSADGRQLASASDDKTIRLWDTATGQCQRILEGHGGPIYSVAFSADGQQLASGSLDDTIKLWNVTTGHCERTLEGHKSWVTSVVFLADRQLLASASNDNTIKLWNVTTGHCERTLEGHTGWVQSVAFLANRQLASASSDCTIRLWNTTTGQCQQVLRGHGKRVLSVAFSGHKLASASDDATVKLWDIGTRQCEQTLEGHKDPVNSMAFSADGRQLASASDTIKLWDTDNGQCRQTIEAFASGASRFDLVVFSADGRQLASALHTHTIQIWDTTTGEDQRLLKAWESWIRQIAFSPDGRQLASVSDRKILLLWDTTTGQSKHILKCRQFPGDDPRLPDGYHPLLEFSVDGRQLASVLGGKTIHLWDTTTGQYKHLLAEHDRISLVVFSADGRQIASALHDKTIRIWDTSTGQCERTLKGCSGLDNVFGTAIQELFHGLDYSFHSWLNPATWITINSQNILWLPQEYRGYCRAVRGSRIAVGCATGRVLILEITSDGQQL